LIVPQSLDSGVVIAEPTIVVTECERAKSNVTSNGKAVVYQSGQSVRHGQNPPGKNSSDPMGNVEMSVVY